MATRIYQGRIVQARFEDENLPQDKESALAALERTNRLFQDAVNYHLVALAGMAEDGKETLGSRFKKQVRAIWEDLPRGKAGACTLQRSIARTLCLPENVGFDAAVAYIFEGCDRLDVLPYVEHYIIEQTQRGEGAIQQQGRELLPKLCNPFFEGNFDYSIKERKANFGKQKLQRELNRDDITDEEIYTLAQEMDLSWVVKTLPNVNHDAPLYYEPEAQKEKISTSMQKLLASVEGGKLRITTIPKYVQSADFREKIQQELLIRKPLKGARLAKSSRGISVDVEQAGIYFMFYPGRVSAALLASKLGKEKVNNERAEVEFDLSAMDNDPLILARGKRGYVYKGFTALPNWAASDNRMFSREWDILAFKEALKTLHGFELKTKERMKIREDFNVQREALEKGTKIKSSGGDDIDEEKPVVALEGDYRFELLKKLVAEISPDPVTEYHISSRTLNDYEEVRALWLKRELMGDCSSHDLSKIVREYQAKSKRFGSQVLFAALCQDEYRPIWHDYHALKDEKLPRSKNILRDFSNWQYLCGQVEKYSRDVRVTAADVVASPRQMIYSDLSNFGNGKGCEFIPSCEGGLRMQVVVRNAEGHWETTSIRVTFSAPRFLRDEMGQDAGKWMVPEKGENTTLPWLQPMMKALGDDIAPVRLERTPAIGLQVRGQGSEACYYLNFPVSLDVTALQKSLGKAARWAGQFLRGRDEKLHLHWPATYKGKNRPWWEQEKEFTVLGIDLGLRSSVAWSLLRVSTCSTSSNSRGDELIGRLIGDSSNAKWYGYVIKQGLSRLPGEQPRRVGDKKIPAVSLASPEDRRIAKLIIEAAGAQYDENESEDVLRLGNRTLKSFKSLTSRLKTYLSFLSGLKDPGRKPAVLKRMADYFAYAEIIPGVCSLLEAHQEDEVYERVLDAAEELRSKLPKYAELVTSLILPRKHGSWKWEPERRKGWQGSGVMRLTEEGGIPHRPVFHRGGLSVARLTQLETLRQLLQSMGKVLSFVPGESVTFGRRLKDEKVIDPCPEILEKIENMREQRVNLIAHDIVAQALGVRLKSSRPHKNSGGLDVIHGEYERIPGREPVDFVVMENLSRYLTSLDRAPLENSGLMRWAHRQIVAKVTQLVEEIFGIPVVFTHAHYTSRFDSMTSEPGFRPVMLKPEYLKWLQRNGKGNECKAAAVYQAIWDEVVNARKTDKVTLVLPHLTKGGELANGGELFLSQKGGKFTLRNADMNAATNIAWRGLAAPESLHLLHRVRMEMKKAGLVPVCDNAREKSLKTGWSLTKLKSIQPDGNKISAFAVSSEWKDEYFAAYGNAETRAYLAYGKTLWGIMKRKQWQMCHLFNIQQLKNAGIDARLVEQLLHTDETDTSDDIPT